MALVRFLASVAGSRTNGLFFAGDLGQRIFQTPFSWKSVGVDIRGRSRNLTINYRTSHQIRMQADRLLGPDQVKREVIDTTTAPWYQGMVPGLNVMPLMRQGSGSTLVKWAPQTYFNPHRHYGGEEIFVVDGVFEDEHGRYPTGSWIRSPHMSMHKPFSKEGCTIFVKTGHLMG